MDDTRQRIIAATYECVARWGLAKTTMDDAAREAELSRATVYRAFPGGRDELIGATIAWAVGEFTTDLLAEISGAATLEQVMERGISFAVATIADHEVLQRVMQTEPDKLLPQLTVESNHLREAIALLLLPYLDQRRLAEGVGAAEAADFLARMIMSYVTAPGRWDLTAPDQVAALVRAELLAGVVAAQ